MKYIYKSILVAIVMIGGFSSCSDSNLAIDTLYDDVNTSGSILRLLTTPEDIIGLPGQTTFVKFLDFDIEVQQGDGSFPPEFVEVRMKIQIFKDQDASVPVVGAPQITIKTILSSDFTETSEVNKLPMYQISIPTEAIIASYPEVQFPGVGFLVTNFELVMTELDADGNNIVWDSTNAGTTLSGPYMSSPFLWKTIFKF